ncbi:MAG TPA: zinc ribbon domain-containing protein [Syntrophaceticus sp.]|nr:zinc ribbon domain-containing protein [Syntrophaceticus sp.]
MPTYDYRCDHCGRFQVTQRITESPLEKCPTCGQPVQRLISRNVAIVFKGPGFYCTDNRIDSVTERKPAGKGKEENKTKTPSKA